MWWLQGSPHQNGISSGCRKYFNRSKGLLRECLDSYTPTHTVSGKRGAFALQNAFNSSWGIISDNLSWYIDPSLASWRGSHDGHPKSQCHVEMVFFEAFGRSRWIQLDDLMDPYFWKHPYGYLLNGCLRMSKFTKVRGSSPECHMDFRNNPFCITADKKPWIDRIHLKPQGGPLLYSYKLYFFWSEWC